MTLSSPSFGAVGLEVSQENSCFRLTVAGLVSRTQQYSMQILQDYFSRRTFTTPGIRDISCARERDVWTGCTLNELLDFVGVSAQARYVELVGYTGHPDSASLNVVSLPIEELEHTEIGLVWEQSGEPVTTENGGPLVALLPGTHGFQVIHGLSRINLIIVPAA
jgi:DMSO/TMAO reductase YedYZ molybdopterin-dependent catalytic subunit